MHGTTRAGVLAAAFALVFALGCGDDAAPPAPPAVDVTGSWDVSVEYLGSWFPLGATTLVMAGDGTVTGTAGGDPVSGLVSGYGINLTVDHGSGYFTYLSGTVDVSETSADGTWHDTDSDSGDWVATKL